MKEANLFIEGLSQSLVRKLRVHFLRSGTLFVPLCISINVAAIELGLLVQVIKLTAVLVIRHRSCRSKSTNTGYLISVMSPVLLVLVPSENSTSSV